MWQWLLVDRQSALHRSKIAVQTATPLAQLAELVRAQYLNLLCQHCLAQLLAWGAAVAAAARLQQPLRLASPRWATAPRGSSATWLRRARPCGRITVVIWWRLCKLYRARTALGSPAATAAAVTAASECTLSGWSCSSICVTARRAFHWRADFIRSITSSSKVDRR